MTSTRFTQKLKNNAIGDLNINPLQNMFIIAQAIIRDFESFYYQNQNYTTLFLTINPKKIFIKCFGLIERDGAGYFFA